ncbi:TetR/AcrR family transcriptional regulator [Brochothrix campestris]|uniref:TetR family transcriptional regulator n=1 Tax=Brochothrix campestris FSL F6-1037 TaxID=1265861 RepID=W7CNH7_9LIST|nr:TetR/AcrR family transcriptional regulator [Brochothrix campestris]EUJ38607.1 TetR family transcriptional regulator [Brochothrix campestris FSL F6-1037]
MMKVTKKQLIFTAAQHLFSEKGYNDTSLQLIAEAVGTTRSNILYHYESKGHLFEIVLKQWEEQWYKSWHVIRDTITKPSEQLMAYFKAFIYEDLRHPLRKALDEYLLEINGQKEERERWVASDRAAFELILRNGMMQGVFRINPAAIRVQVDVLVGFIYGVSDTMENKTEAELLAAVNFFLKMYLLTITTGFSEEVNR